MCGVVRAKGLKRKEESVRSDLLACGAASLRASFLAGANAASTASSSSTLLETFFVQTHTHTHPHYTYTRQLLHREDIVLQQHDNLRLSHEASALTRVLCAWLLFQTQHIF